MELFSQQSKYSTEYSPNTLMIHSIVDIGMGLLYQSLSTSLDLSSWEFAMDLQSITPDF
jgi:hypothetical protein